MDMDNLKNEINAQIGVEVFELVNDVIKFKSNVNGKFVKKFFLDDLVTFFNGKPRMTLRLLNLILEVSQEQVGVTRECAFIKHKKDK